MGNTRWRNFFASPRTATQAANAPAIQAPAFAPVSPQAIPGMPRLSPDTLLQAYAAFLSPRPDQPVTLGAAEARTALLWLHGVRDGNVRSNARYFDEEYLIDGSKHVEALKRMQQQWSSQYGAASDFRAPMIAALVPFLDHKSDRFDNFGDWYSAAVNDAAAQGAAMGTPAYNRIMRNKLFEKFTDVAVPPGRDVNDFRFDDATATLQPFPRLANALPFARSPPQMFGDGVRLSWPNRL